MKKLYLLPITICAFLISANAQIIDDNFDFYTPGPMGNQAPWWTTWSGVTGTAEDIQVVTDNSNSGTQSGFVGPGGVAPDALLLLGNPTTGKWIVEWQMFVPAGATGYWNIQEDEAAPGLQWNDEFYVGATAVGGAAGVITSLQTGDTAPYPEDQWFLIHHEIDLDALTYTVEIDGAAFVTNAPYIGAQLGSIDFFSVDANNQYWVDDVIYDEMFITGTDDFSKENFSVYPNPVRDILHINTVTAVDNINVYDVLGKLVLQSQPDAVSPHIDMSTLSSGAYLVQVTIGNASKTVKVIK